jgi:hypothetical protein
LTLGRSGYSYRRVLCTITKGIKKKKTKHYQGQTQVAHVCNPSYLGGKDQEDCGLKPAQANTL